MGIFGPIDNNKAIEIILDNYDEIIEETNEALEGICKNRDSIVTNKTGLEIMWSIIEKAEKEIPNYLFNEGNVKFMNYPFGDPYKYVCCAIIYKYSNADKKEKKNLSSAIEKFGKDGLRGFIFDIVKAYCDNIEKSLTKSRQFDNSKETAIMSLAENCAFYNEMFVNNSRNNDGNSRTRK